MAIKIRGLVKELLKNDYLLVKYEELENGGFDLIVRIDKNALEEIEEKKQ